MLPTDVPRKEMFPSCDRVLDTVPLVVDENQVVLFTFYLDNAVRVGMRYGNELYGLIREMSAQARLDAYQLGYELILQGAPVLITASKQRYALWRNLRVPEVTQQDWKILEAKVCVTRS